MSKKLKYLLVTVHLVVAGIMSAQFILAEGIVGSGISSFAGFWALIGSALLMIIANSEGTGLVPGAESYC